LLGGFKMKTIIAIIAAVSLLAVGTMAFAHGSNGWGSSHMGQGNGGYMMGKGYGKGGGTDLKADHEFLDKTADMRKALHDKKFEYREAARNPETTVGTLTKLKKDIFDLKTKIREIAPRSAAYSGNGSCWDK
jgi:hypothetical protein